MNYFTVSKAIRLSTSPQSPLIHINNMCELVSRLCSTVKMFQKFRKKQLSCQSISACVCVCGHSCRIKMLLTGVAPIGCCRRDSNANRLHLLVQLQLSWKGGGAKRLGEGATEGQRVAAAVAYPSASAVLRLFVGHPPVSDRKPFQVTSPLAGSGGIKLCLVVRLSEQRRAVPLRFRSFYAQLSELRPDSALKL